MYAGVQISKQLGDPDRWAKGPHAGEAGEQIYLERRLLGQSSRGNSAYQRNIEISTYFAIAIAGILVLRLGCCNEIGCGVYDFVQLITCWICALPHTVIHGTIKVHCSLFIRNCQSSRKERYKVEISNPAKDIRATAILEA